MSKWHDQDDPSSLTSAEKGRRAASRRFAERMHEWMQTWTCLGPGCRHKTPHHFYCSATCKEASMEDTRKHRGRRQ